MKEMQECLLGQEDYFYQAHACVGCGLSRVNILLGAAAGSVIR